MSSSTPAAPGATGNWSDGETSALVEAWGQLYLRGNRGFLRDAEWRQVCGAVNAHRAAAGRRFDRSVVHCKWRLYSLKSQYKKELAKHGPSGCRHFVQFRAFLAGPDAGPPPGFAAKMSAASVKEEEMVEEEEEEVEEKKEEEAVEEKEEVEEKEQVGEASGGASGSVERRTVPAKRHFSSIQDRSDSPPPGFATRMPATVNKEKEKVKVEEEEVGREGPANGAAGAGCCPAAVVTKLAEVVTELPALVTKLAEVYERVEMERLSVEKGKMEMEWEKRAPKVEAENLGETDDN